MTEAPIFKSTMQAIQVSYLLAALPASEKGNTQSIIEWMRDKAGKPEPEIAEELRKVNFSGLTRQEVRGQCALVRSAVERMCMAPEIHALRLKFANDATKADAVRYFADYLPDGSFTSRDLKAHVLWYLFMEQKTRDKYGLSLRAFEGQYGMDHVAIQRECVKITRTTNGLRDQGAKRIDAYLIAKGVVGAEQLTNTA